MSARNVINVAALDEFLDEVGEICDHQATARWLGRNARRWILASYEQVWDVAREPMTDRLVLVDPDEPDRVIGAYDDEVPDWGVRALARGDRLVALRLNRTLAKRLGRIIAWIEETADPIRGPRLERLGFRDADAQADRWWRERHKGPEWPAGVTPVFHMHGNTIVRLTGADPLREEGQAMNHCVGDYVWEVQEGISEIYSLRDREGDPQATIELQPEDNVILQIKGPSNGPVAAPFQPTINTFFNQQGWKVRYDQENLGRDPAMLEWDLAGFRRYLATPAAAEAIRLLRYTPVEAVISERRDPLFTQLDLHGPRLPNRQRRALFYLLMPERAPFAFQPRRQIWAYGELWPVWEVCTPLPLLALANFGVFSDLDIADQVGALRRRLEGMLPMLFFREPDRLFDLGPSDMPGWTPDDITFGPVAWIRAGAIELEPLREARHTRIRQRLNAAKRREIGKWADRTEEHEDIRALLAGETGRYIV